MRRSIPIASPSIQSLRGFRDLSVLESSALELLRNAFIKEAELYNYPLREFPILEAKAVFEKSLGEMSDVVQKEMFCLETLGGDSAVLRPEGTAGAVRALVGETGGNREVRASYVGPMFRYERPQRGRYRQFYQAGVECLGGQSNRAEVDAEVLALGASFLHRVGIDETSVDLHIGSLGDVEARRVYEEQLRSWFVMHESCLSKESKQRLERGAVLRILDSKHPGDRALLRGGKGGWSAWKEGGVESVDEEMEGEGVPLLLDCLSGKSRDRLSDVVEIAAKMGVGNVVIDPFLVRGLDYYGETVFEWIHRDTGDAIVAGGRYDALSTALSLPPTPGVGLAVGLDRIASLLTPPPAPTPTIVITPLSPKIEAISLAASIAHVVRQQRNTPVSLTHPIRKPNKAARHAHKLGASVFLCVGEDEVATQTVSAKHMQSGSQVQVDLGGGEFGASLRSVIDSMIGERE